ncbi:MAG: siderophore-interacting protein [Tessaracoccus sp.]
MPKTPRPLSIHPVSLRELEVARVADVTPGMRRVTLTGAQLGAFTSANGLEQPEFTSQGFDDSFRFYFAYPGEEEPVLPTQTAGLLEQPKERRPLFKVYTVRRYDPHTRELVVDFVKHGVGVATTWAERAKPGDRIHIAGPSASRGRPIGFDWWLVAGDETALPAIARMLEEAPEDLRAQVFIEIADDSHRISLPEFVDRRDLAGVELTWLSRAGAPPVTGSRLLEAVRGADWWDGETFAWIAAERSVVQNLRRHLIEERSLDKSAIDFTGYWKHTEVVALDTDAAVPDPEKNTPAFEKFHDLIELVPPLAIRVAAGLRIGEHISRGITTVPELARTTGSNERALGKLLRYLQTIDLLDQGEPGRYALTEVGEFLAMEIWNEYLDPDGVDGLREAGIFGLAESIRTGRSAYAAVTGREFAQVRAEQAHEDAFLTKIAPFQAYVAAPIANSDLLKDVEHLVIHSPGAGSQAREFIALHSDLTITICALPAQADWLRRDLPESVPDEQQRSRISVVEQSIFEPTPAADAVFVIRALGGLPDADATHALRRMAENLPAGGRVLMIEDTFDLDHLDDHDGEADLLALTRDGTGLRTTAELDAVIEGAGLARVTTHSVGWGTPVYELVPTEA